MPLFLSRIRLSVPPVIDINGVYTRSAVLVDLHRFSPTRGLALLVCFWCWYHSGMSSSQQSHLLFFLLFGLFLLSLSFFSLSLHRLLCLLHYNVVSLCRGFVTTELVSP